MSYFTTELRYICEQQSGLDLSTDNYKNVIEQARSKIFSYYPIFDEAYRQTLETKILKHYYTREICEETFGLWKLRLDARMNEIMPYYNKLYSSELLKYNPLYDTDLYTDKNRKEDSKRNSKSETITNRNDKKETDAITDRSASNETDHNEEENADTKTKNMLYANENSHNENAATATGNSKTDTNNSKTQKDLYSDTPQGSIQNLESERYLTNARKIGSIETSNSVGEQTSASNAKEDNVNNKTENASGETITGSVNKYKDKSNLTEEVTNSGIEKIKSENVGMNTDNMNINTTEEYIEHVYGKRSGVTFSKLIKEFRDTLLNIDIQIINSLSDLFFGLYV